MEATHPGLSLAPRGAVRTCVLGRARLDAASLVVQPSLFGSSGELGIADLGAAVERRLLSDGAWIDVRPGFVTAADDVFDALVSSVPWHEERMHMYDTTGRVPRLLARYAQGEALPIRCSMMPARH
jgi:alkylated DNA repair dioxygenase AlkB